MELKDLYLAVESAKTDIVAQQAVVDGLAAKITAGETTIEVYAKDVGWSVVNLKTYWQVQYDKLMALMTYAGQLDGLQVSLQQILDAQLPTIPVPNADKAAEVVAPAKDESAEA